MGTTDISHKFSALIHLYPRIRVRGPRCKVMGARKSRRATEEGLQCSRYIRPAHPQGPQSQRRPMSEGSKVRNPRCRVPSQRRWDPERLAFTFAPSKKIAGGCARAPGCLSALPSCPGWHRSHPLGARKLACARVHDACCVMHVLLLIVPFARSYF